MRTIVFLLLLHITPVFPQGIARIPISHADRFVYSRILPDCRIIDTAYINVAYEYLFMTDTIKKQRWRDIVILQVGRSYAKYFSGRGYVIDSLNSTKTVLPHSKLDFAQLWFSFNHSNDESAYYTSRTDILWNGQQHVFTVWQPEPTSYHTGQGYVYQDLISDLKWELCNSEHTEPILGYNCIKATTVFRGRTYIAWFTPDIPVHIGPWKFVGLPGLILRVETEDRQFYWGCRMISSQPIPIVEFFYDYKTTTRQQHMKFERRIHKTPQILFEMNGMEVRLFDRQRLYSPEEIEWTIPYNPIELE